MIICICLNVSDRVIKQAAASGAKTLEDVRKITPIGGCCGKCHKAAKQTLDEAVAQINLNTEVPGCHLTAIAASVTEVPVLDTVSHHHSNEAAVSEVKITPKEAIGNAIATFTALEIKRVKSIAEELTKKPKDEFVCEIKTSLKMA